MSEQCRFEIEGQKIGGRRLPMYRRRCRNKAVAGYRNCHHHLTLEERERRAAEKSSP